MNYLLDTNTCIAAMRSHPLVVQRLSAVSPGEAASIRGTLEALGQPIGPYDKLLAGHAMSLRLVLVTNNTAEFSRVGGLALENWQTPTPTP